MKQNEDLTTESLFQFPNSDQESSVFSQRKKVAKRHKARPSSSKTQRVEHAKKEPLQSTVPLLKRKVGRPPSVKKEPEKTIILNEKTSRRPLRSNTVIPEEKPKKREKKALDKKVKREERQET